MVPEEKSFVAMLIQRLKDPQLTVRVHAGVLLGGMGAKARPALPTLLELLASDDRHNRRLAALTLGFLGHEVAEGVPPLRNALHDEDETVRRLAADALQEIATADARAKAA
jgi:HEAT repeat protein